jgi:hypothetical protein
MLLPVIFFVIFFSVLLFFQHVRSKEAFDRIRRDLKHRNLQLIDIDQHTFGPFESKRGYFYDVEYMNSNYEVYRARCQFGTNWQIYWTEPTYRNRLSPGQAERLLSGKSGIEISLDVDPKPEKERLIDGLKSNFKYERIWTANEIKELESVDEQVMFILQELSVSDPDPEVREAAQGTIQKLDIIS